MKTLHYYASKKEKFVVVGNDGKFSIDDKKHPVSGKAHANRLAKELNAKPWNF